MLKTIAAVSVLACGFAATAQPSFTGLGFLPAAHPSTAQGVSGDGGVVAGVSGNTFFRWTVAGGMQDIGSVPGAFAPTVTAVSADGTTIVGYVQLSVGYRAFRWTATGGFVVLQPIGGNVSGAYSFANDVNADGTVVVGASRPSASSSERAVRWLSGGAPQDLFPGHMLGVSADGSIGAGSVSYTGFNHAARWTSAAGYSDLTPQLAQGAVSTAYGVSADGSAVAGKIGESLYLFRVVSGVEQRLLATATSTTRYYPYGISDDGTVIVGEFYTSAPVATDRAMYWTPSLGVVDLNTYLPTIGIDLAGWTLDRANAASADGTVIVGRGTHQGEAEAWVARIPRGCLTDVGVQGGFAGHDGALDNNDFIVFISLFFTLDLRADRGVQGGVAGTDGLFDNNDFIVFIDQFFAGC